MNGSGELILYLIQRLFLFTGIVFLILAFFIKKRIIALCICLISFLLFFQFKSCQSDSYEMVQKREVGTYYLTQYPNCKNCYVRLNDNMTYNVFENGKIIETNNWHTDIGQDYWITYMNDNKDQLGFGKFKYDKYEKKYSD
jgi:hypothetical protein